ncbi:efflux transporter outer membrane subunit [Janthinobacterium sp. FT14W]|uniref:efflux transporter outer membrane subunit n=1 Tax=Janthinobacterium sp. FT14W TaxID=2654253 RepID=UPI00126488AD|nr:efflux transporter outer membrane subunit [Janthinobacterium sp. FT14W]KAB8049194.1 efflux transporter outer membrane subunit [Janthinobacterium sp. FT14W]
MNERACHPRPPCARRAVAAALVALAASGCTAGPDFVRPAAPPFEHYTRHDGAILAHGEGGAAQSLRGGQAVPARWWQAFGSPALDALVAMALDGSASLASARDTVAQAQHVLDAARGARYPRIDLTASGVRAKGGRDGGLDRVANVLSFGPALSADADAFGATRRRIEQAQALSDYQFAQWQSARLSLSGNTVRQAITLAAAREQIAAVGDIIAVDQRNLDLVRLAAQAGKSARLDVLTAESQLDSDRALLPPLQQQASVAAHALAVLAGKTAPWQPPPFTLQAFTLPARLPLVLPSLLVRRRPDILAAEAQLHAASAAIGIAAAQLYPDVTLSAQWTATGATAGSLLGGASLWSLAASLVAPVFDAGVLAAQRAAATDAYAAQLEAYRQTVLQAFGQVADALEALQHDVALLEAQRKALETALAVLGLTQQSYQAGQASLLQLLEAQRLYQQARLGHARVQGQRHADTAQWFIVMGGAQPDQLP